MYESGGDRAKRPFEECEGLASAKNKRWSVIVERAVSSFVTSRSVHRSIDRAASASAGRGPRLRNPHEAEAQERHEVQRRHHFLRGLRPPARSRVRSPPLSHSFALRSPTTVSGRRYAHFLGVIISVFTTSRDRDTVHVELSADIADPNEELDVSRRLLLAFSA